MAGERNYIRVPPDSTGKAFSISHQLKLFYENKNTNIAWEIDANYILGSSAIKATLHDFHEINTTSGYVVFTLDEDDRDSNLEPIASETIINNDSQITAYVVSWEDIYVNHTKVVGSHPEYALNIDKQGAANVRFSEGQPQLDAFGKLRTSQSTVLGNYSFLHNVNEKDFTSYIDEDGILAHSIGLSCVQLKLPAASTGTVAHTTNTYHHYFPGQSHLILMTVALTDVSQQGVDRSWGYFDDRNGYFFRCNGGSLELVIRSDINKTMQESPSETVITTFNKDPIDGTGLSGFSIDLSKDNIYWIDFQWLGAGRIRFGTYYKGQRIVIHEYYHNDNLGVPTARTGSLPFRLFTTGSGISSGETVLNCWCAVVVTEHSADLSKKGVNNLETFEFSLNPSSLEDGQEYQLIGIVSPSLFYKEHDMINRTLYFPQYIESMAFDQDGNEALCEFEVYIDAIVSGNNTSFNTRASDIELHPTLTVDDLPLLNISGNDLVESYKHSRAKAKYWGGGIHGFAQYVKGYGRSDLSNSFSDFQQGSFKNYSEDGGYMSFDVSSWSLGATTSLTNSYNSIKEGAKVRFSGVTGTAASVLNYSENGNKEFYLKLTGLTTATLYEESTFDTPVDTTSLTATGGKAETLKNGSNFYFVIVVKPVFIGSMTTLNVRFNLGWKEIRQ